MPRQTAPEKVQITISDKEKCRLNLLLAPFPGIGADTITAISPAKSFLVSLCPAATMWQCHIPVLTIPGPQSSCQAVIIPIKIWGPSAWQGTMGRAGGGARSILNWDHINSAVIRNMHQKNVMKSKSHLDCSNRVGVLV